MNIGIAGRVSYQDSFFGVGAPYMEYLSQWGPVYPIPPTATAEDIVRFFGLVVLPGGSDLNTMRYRQAPNFILYDSDQHLEYFDINILPSLVKAKLPIFGICRGLQTLNVHFGGTLIQNLLSHPHSDPRTQLVHEVSFALGARKSIKVNSMHHQAVGELGVELRPISYSGDDIVEAVLHEDLPIAGVQWHPEEIYDGISEYLLAHILS